MCLMMSNDLIFRKLSETQADKRKFVYNCLLRQYGSLDLIPLEAWREVLPKESYRVCRLNGMESIGSGTLTKNHLPGIYSCICCGAELFDSNDKYGSMGWLSFCRSIGSDKNVERVPDMRYETKRIEIQCKNCKSHLGNLHSDIVSPTGVRYTINSASLDFNNEKYDVALRKFSVQSV